MDFLAWFVWKKKLKRAIYVGSVLYTSATRGRLYICIQSTCIYLCYIIYAPHVTFIFESSIFALFTMIMALRKKRVRTLHDRLKIIHEVEKNPGEKCVDIAKWLGLPTSTLNTIFAKKNDIREQIQKCGNTCKKRKNGKESTYAELETVLFTWYQQARGSNIPIDGTILKIIAAKLKIDYFSASSGWLSRFKHRHGLVFKKLVGECWSKCKEYWCMAGKSAIFTGRLRSMRCIQRRRDGAILQRASWKNLGV
jgi:hypothetical protein